MDEKIIELKFPIPVPTINGKTVDVSSIKLGRLKAKHLKLLPEDFTEKEGRITPAQIIPLIAGLADIPVESAEEIDFEDLVEISEGIGDFLETSLSTGKK